MRQHRFQNWLYIPGGSDFHQQDPYITTLTSRGNTARSRHQGSARPHKREASADPVGDMLIVRRGRRKKIKNPEHPLMAPANWVN